MFENERSTDDIRKDITREEENPERLTKLVIVSKKDLIAYVKESPYWALGAAAGVFLSQRWCNHLLLQ